MKTVWDKIVETDYEDSVNKTDNIWEKVMGKMVGKMVCKFLNCKQPRDAMLTHMAPRGGLIKDPFQTAQTHSLRWKTMLRVSKQLPKGENGDMDVPGKKLQLKWFCHSFCKEHRNLYKASG